MDTLDRILELLKEKGISQKQLAEALGLLETNISEWKKGKSKSYLKYIYQIADILEVDVDYLLCKTEKSTPSGNMRQLTSKDALQILADENNLSKKDIEYLEDTLKLLKLKNALESANDGLGKELNPVQP